MPRISPERPTPAMCIQSRLLSGSQAKGVASSLHQLRQDITRAVRPVRGCMAIPHLGCNPRDGLLIASALRGITCTTWQVRLWNAILKTPQWCAGGAAARVKVHSASSLRLKLKSTERETAREAGGSGTRPLNQHHPPYRPRAPSDDTTHLTTPQEYRARGVRHIPSELGHSGNLTTPQYPPNQPSSNLTHTACSDTSEDLKTRTSMPPMGFSSSVPAPCGRMLPI